MIVVELKTIFSFEGWEIDEYPLNGNGNPELTSTHSIGERTWEVLSDLRNDRRGDWRSLKRRLMTALGGEGKRLEHFGISQRI